MKKVILMMLALCFVTMNAYSQRVYRSANDNKVYLECTVANGMPDGSVDRITKSVGGTASDLTFRDGTKNVDPFIAEALTVFESLRIHTMDEPDSDGVGNSYSWADSYYRCKDSGRRLPNLRELTLMYIFRTPLNALLVASGGKALVNELYWSSTELEAKYAMNVDFGSGTITSHEKTKTTIRTRCVQEVPIGL